MSEETNTRKPTDPMDVWEQWYETVSKGWSNTVHGNGNGHAAGSSDPFNLYQTWLKGITDAQEQFKQSSGDPQQLWTRWFETTTAIWRQSAAVGGDPLGLTTQWLEMMEEAQARLLAGVKLPTDPFTFFKQWYDSMSETWSAVIGKLIGTEKFMEVSSELLRSYASFYGTARRANEEYFRNLQLPTRTDIARVAGLVVSLEDKVDRIESMLEDAEDRSGQLATSDSVASLHKRVADVEKRLDRMEGKLDTLLTSLEMLATREYTEVVKSAETTRPRRRTPSKAEVQSQEEGGTEAQLSS